MEIEDNVAPLDVLSVDKIAVGGGGGACLGGGREAGAPAAFSTGAAQAPAAATLVSSTDAAGAPNRMRGRGGGEREVSGLEGGDFDRTSRRGEVGRAMLGWLRQTACEERTTTVTVELRPREGARIHHTHVACIRTGLGRRVGRTSSSFDHGRSTSMADTCCPLMRVLVHVSWRSRACIKNRRSGGPEYWPLVVFEERQAGHGKFLLSFGVCSLCGWDFLIQHSTH